MERLRFVNKVTTEAPTSDREERLRANVEIP
jgi:hypothetical protein